MSVLFRHSVHTSFAVATLFWSIAFAGTPLLTPAQRKITGAQQLILENARYVPAYAELASAFIARARETDDRSYLAQAEDAIEKGLTIEPNAYLPLIAHLRVLISKEEFTAASRLGRQLYDRAPDNLEVSALLADIYLALGDYTAAEKSTQYIMDLRPRHLYALTRGAELRYVWGDVPGALEYLQMALARVPPDEQEERARILLRMGEIRSLVADLPGAELLYQEALRLFPGYPPALGAMGRLKFRQGKSDEALALMRQRVEVAPRANALFDLASLLRSLGHKTDAAAIWKRFQAKAAEEHDNRALIRYFLHIDHFASSTDALLLATREAQQRHDVETLDLYAVALLVNQQPHEARQQIDRALSTGVRHPEYFRHASLIALSLRDQAAAQRYCEQARALDHAGPCAAAR